MDVKGKNIYISGKMTGLPNFNRQAFLDAMEDFIEDGAALVYNPAINAPKIEETKEHSYYMIHDLHELTKWDSDQEKPFYDVIAMLQGWEDSTGAWLEFYVAVACGIQVALEVAE